MQVDAIDTNISAIDAARSLDLEEENKRRSLERLASSDRIRRTQDEAATVKVSDDAAVQRRIDADLAIRTSLVAETLAGAAVSALINTATNMTRLGQLQALAASTALTDLQRGNVQIEIDAIKTELERVTKADKSDRETAAIAATAQASNGAAVSTVKIQTTSAAALSAADTSHIIVDRSEASVTAQANQDPQIALKLLDDEA